VIDDDSEFAIWLKDNPLPDLQELIERAGRRYAASTATEARSSRAAGGATLGNSAVLSRMQGTLNGVAVKNAPMKVQASRSTMSYARLVQRGQLRALHRRL